MSPDLVALHLGALHPAEQVLILVLAFGPFVVLGAVVALRRRHEDKEESAPDAVLQEVGARVDQPQRDR